MPKVRNILVSVSGGRSSHYMAWRMVRDSNYSHNNLLFAFSNTGKEREETLDFVNRCDIEWGLGIVWLEAKVNPEYRQSTTYTRVTYETASRKGQPFESMMHKYGIPNAAYPHCTRELKQRPIRAYASEYFNGEPYVTAIGIRCDEARRIRAGDSDFIYPLVEWGIRVETVRKFWNESPFDLHLRDYEGNCDLCWKKSKRKILTLLKERPEISDWWNEMEIRYGMLRLPTRAPTESPVVFGRHNESISNLIEQSRLPFTPVTDPFWKKESTGTMDDESPCECMQSDTE